MRVSTLPVSSLGGRRSVRLAAAALAATLVLTACSGDGDDGASESPTAPTQQTEAATGEVAGTETPEQSDDPGEAESAAEAGIDPAELPEPFASFEMGAGGLKDPDATMKIDIYPLQRDGDLVTLVAGMTLQAEPTERTTLRMLLGGDGVNPVLVDTVNLRSHQVVSTDGGRLSTSTLVTGMSGGQTRYWHGVFAAPPEDVTTMTVLFDGVPAVTSVPIR